MSPRSLSRLRALRLPTDAAVPHPVGLGALPGVGNPLLFLLRRREEWRKQEERWCEGKPPGARQGLHLAAFPPTRPGFQGWGETGALLMVFWQMWSLVQLGRPQDWGRGQGRGRAESRWERQVAWGWGGHKERSRSEGDFCGSLGWEDWQVRGYKEETELIMRGDLLLPECGLAGLGPRPSVHPSPTHKAHGGWIAIPCGFGIQRHPPLSRPASSVPRSPSSPDPGLSSVPTPDARAISFHSPLTPPSLLPSSLFSLCSLGPAPALCSSLLPCHWLALWVLLS